MSRKHIPLRVAAVLAVATFFCQCKGKLAEAEVLDMGEVPFQRVEDMFLVQTTNGVLQRRAEAPLMESYDRDTMSFEKFPKGLSVYSYNEAGDLETVIIGDEALHTKVKKSGEEKWAIFGNVLVQNVVKHEVMETDTLYWDRDKEEIYSDCYVKMYSQDGFMQGYGFTSDEKARNSVLHKPFNGFGVVVKDTTVVVVDSVNFIGPMPKN